MTSWGDQTDEAINRAVAEAMGWECKRADPEARENYRDMSETRFWCLSESDWYWEHPEKKGYVCDRCDGVPTGDVCNDWQAFGRLLKHIRQRFPGLYWLMGANDSRGEPVEVELCSGDEAPMTLRHAVIARADDLRRALAIAFLEAVEIEIEPDA